METLGQTREGRTLFTAAVTLVIIGISLSIFTWLMLSRQKEAGEKHLLVNAVSLFETVESIVRRTQLREGRRDFFPRVEGLFEEMERSGDVAFVGIFGQHGGPIIASSSSSGPGTEKNFLALSPEEGRLLITNGVWYGPVTWKGKQLFLYAHKVMPPEFRLSGYAAPGQEGKQREGEHPGGAMPGGPESEYYSSTWEAFVPDSFLPPPADGMRPDGIRKHDMPLIVDLPMFLVVGLDMERHRNIYKGFTQSAVLQTAYILAAALFIWVLTINFMSRRELAGKARVLERFQVSLLDNIPDGFLTVTPNPSSPSALPLALSGEPQEFSLHEEGGMIAAANPAVHKLLNFAQGSLVGSPVEALPSVVRDYIRTCRITQGGPVDCATVPTWGRVSLGKAQLEILCSVFQGDNGEATRLVLIRDRTREHELEKSLAEAEKLAAVGTLAAGVAHEIRNPLSTLRGFAQYFAKKLSGQKPEGVYAETMVKEADRLNRVVTDLLYLSRQKQIEPVCQDLPALARELADLMHLDLQSLGVTLVLKIVAPKVWADPHALKQALINLVLNSLDALAPQEGLGTPRSEKSLFPDRRRVITISSYKGSSSNEDGGAGVWLEVADNGPGMSHEDIAQAFEPFYTRKDKGVGLGLALVHKTMREHGGTARIRSEGGCRVQLFFPESPDCG